MFTGIIADVGEIKSMAHHASGARMIVGTNLDLSDVSLGDSVAVNGACLTVIRLGPGQFEADLSEETLDRTSLAGARAGQTVNLELALRMGDRLGGHLVQGHVDGVGRLIDRTSVGDCWDLTFEIPADLMGTVIEKGSITLDGVSLTVARLDSARVTIAVVPHTAEKTTLGKMAIDAPVNVETDVIGKYVARLLSRPAEGDNPEPITLEMLQKLGFA